MRIAAFGLLALVATTTQLAAAVYDWSNTCLAQSFNKTNVRDPTIIYNHWDEEGDYTPYSCPGYDGTQYAFAPCNFVPNVNSVPSQVWTHIDLVQFGIPATAKEVFLTGHAEIMDWYGTQYLEFRAPGSTWNLSSLTDSGHNDTIGEIPVPVAPLPASEVNPNILIPVDGQYVHEQAGDPAVDVSWTVVTTPQTLPNVEYQVNMILSGWCQ